MSQQESGYVTYGFAIFVGLYIIARALDNKHLVESTKMKYWVLCVVFCAVWTLSSAIALLGVYTHGQEPGGKNFWAGILSMSGACVSMFKCLPLKPEDETPEKDTYNIRHKRGRVRR